MRVCVHPPHSLSPFQSFDPGLMFLLSHLPHAHFLHLSPHHRKRLWMPTVPLHQGPGNGLFPPSPGPQHPQVLHRKVFPPQWCWLPLLMP